MICYGVLVLALCFIEKEVSGLWEKETICPNLCTCRLEHISETAIYRFVKDGIEKDQPSVVEAVTLEDNEVFYDDSDEFDESSFLKTATCMIQVETNIEQLFVQLPKELQSITLLQTVDSGNKSLKTSDFKVFPELQVLDLQSVQANQFKNKSAFLLEIDEALEKLQYFNLERVVLSNSRKRSQKIEEEVTVFEILQTTRDGHKITLVQKKSGENILPYKSYMENAKSSEGPLFMGFNDLLLLRINECDLKHIHWEMFESLDNLKTLILEGNKLKFISDFAFYGTPNLKTLSLAYNHLLNIQLTDLAGLLELEYLDLSYNNFSQLSELSLPPFPKLKLANFANNPITDVFPNTFEVMNTTDSLILGGSEEPLSLQRNSFVGLKLLRSLKLHHLDIPLFQREILFGMVSLQVLVLMGNIPEIQYDAFLEVTNLDTLLLSSCNISKLSVDSFIGLNKLRTLDISKNNLETLPPGLFDDLHNLNELYMSGNKLKQLPKDLFSSLTVKLIRLNDNPWHCSCEMSDWKPNLINRIKQRSIKPCDRRHDKGTDCDSSNKTYYKYVYENTVAPKCATPNKFKNWSVFHVMRRQFKCTEFKPKFKKKVWKQKKLSLILDSGVPDENKHSNEETTTTTAIFDNNIVHNLMAKKEQQSRSQSSFEINNNEDDNNLFSFNYT